MRFLQFLLVGFPGFALATTAVCPGEVVTAARQARYEFFIQNSDHNAVILQAHVELLDRKWPAGKRLKVADFGTGSGSFLALLLHQAKVFRILPKLSLVDKDPLALLTAPKRLRDLAEEPIACFQDSDPWLARRTADTKNYNLIVAKYSLQHHDDPKRATENLYEKLAPGGALVITLPSNEGGLSKIRDEATRVAGKFKTTPINVGMVNTFLPVLDVDEIHTYQSTFKFRDTSGNRQLVGEFVAGELAKELGKAKTQALFDPYAADGHITIPLVDEVLYVEKPEPKK